MTTALMMTTPANRNSIEDRVRRLTPSDRRWVVALSGIDHKTLARCASGRPTRPTTMERIAAALREIDAAR